MRIAMIGSRGIPARYGGVEIAVQELSSRLAARGHDVTVYCRAEDYAEHPSTVDGVHCRYVRTPGGRMSGAFVQAALASLDAGFHGYDVVHYHAMGPGLFAPLARLRGRRVVSTVHGRDDLRAKWGPMARRLMRIAAWSSTRVPHATITVSRELTADVGSTFRRDAVYIPNGASAPAETGWTVAEQHAAVRQLGLEPGGYLLNVGRLVPEKSVDVLLRGFADLPTDVSLAIAGDSSHTDEFARSVRRQAESDPRVHLLGPVYGARIDALFRHALGFVQASSLEGLPLVLLEACAYGLPVVASDIGPHLEVIGGQPGALVFPVGCASALTERLAQLLATDPARRRDEADQLRAGVLRRFDWAEVADRTLAVYESLP